MRHPTTSTWIITSLLALTLALPSLGCQPDPTVEVRLAATEPGPGLTRADLKGSDKPIYLGEVILREGDIADRAPLEDGSPSYTITLTPEATRRFAQVTQEHVGQPMAIVVNGEVTSAPVIREVIEGGKLQVTLR